MANPKEVLSPAEYKNYRKVRAVAVGFIAFGSMLVIGGIGLTTGEGPADEKKLPPVVGILAAIVGLAGAVGGVATLLGSRRWAPLVKVMAWLWIWGFPIGTILSLTILDGLAKYLNSVERIRLAEIIVEDSDDKVEVV